MTDDLSERGDLRDAGLIRHLGITNVTPAQLAEAQAVAPVVCVQNRYAIGARPEEVAFVRTCGEQGVAFVPFFAIAGDGREAGATHHDRDEILAVARARRDTRSDQARLDSPPGRARARDPGDRQPRPRSRERSRRRAAGLTRRARSAWSVEQHLTRTREIGGAKCVCWCRDIRSERGDD